MDIKLIVAIIRRDRLEPVEEKLKMMSVERINVSKVKGYGEYRDFYAEATPEEFWPRHERGRNEHLAEEA